MKAQRKRVCATIGFSFQKPEVSENRQNYEVAAGAMSTAVSANAVTVATAGVVLADVRPVTAGEVVAAGAVLADAVLVEETLLASTAVSIIDKSNIMFINCTCCLFLPPYTNRSAVIQ